MFIKKEKVYEAAYSLIEDFMDAFNEKSTAKLKAEFGMTPAIYNEAREYLDDYFNTDQYLLKPPPKKGASPHLLEDNLLDIYGTDEETDCWRINCRLFSEQGEEEISANFDLFYDKEQFKLKYLYTAS